MKITLYLQSHIVRYSPHRMPAKKKTIPLRVSRARIEREKANLILRTQRRIALLRANANSKDYDTDDKPVPCFT